MNQPNKKKPDKGPEPDPTIVADLGKAVPVSDDRTVVCDLNRAPGQAKSAVQGDDPTIHTRSGAAPGATQVTRASNAGPATQMTSSGERPSEILTDLNVPGGQAPAPGRDKGIGTHTKQVWGDFELGDLLGRGGMGSVYKGRQVSLDRPVAIKVLPPHLSENENFRARFALEAKAVARLSSPHVIQVFGAGVHQGHHYFAMEYVEGEDLSRRIKKGLRPTYREALDLIIQATRGLVAAGEHGLVHRDIKPANMMITGKGVLKLMDFGLVKLARSEESGLTMAGTIMGTVNYFSPEQGRGEPCDHRTDIYAIGVVFYELLTGKLPFTGADATSVIYQHIHQAPKAPKEIDPNIPEDYQAVALKCMQKRADDRYPSAGDLLADLEALQQGRSPDTAFIDPAAIRAGGMVVKKDPFAKERKSSAPLVAVALVLLAAGGGATAWFMTRGAPVTSGPIASVTAGTILSTPAAGPDREEHLREASKLVKEGSWDKARNLITAAALRDKHDADWTELLNQLDQREGQALLAQAQQAFAAADYDNAGRYAASASGRLGENPELERLKEQLAQREGKDKQRDRDLRAAIGYIATEPAKAESMLEALRKDWPNDPEIDQKLRDAIHQRQIHEAELEATARQLEQANKQVAYGNRALERKEYDKAREFFIAAIGLQPSSVEAEKGLDAVSQADEAIAKINDRFNDALKQKDYATAERVIVDLREVGPESKARSDAERQLADHRATEAERAKRQREDLATLSAQSAGVLAVINDPRKGVQDMEGALANLLAKSGGNLADRAMLEGKIDDRRQQNRFEADMVGLDRALSGKDAAAIGQRVRDPEFASALTELTVYPGLVFETQVDDFLRDTSDPKKAKAKVTITHALAVFPKRRLTYRYDLRAEPEGWVIVSAQLQQ